MGGPIGKLFYKKIVLAKNCPGNWCPYVFVQTCECNSECVCAFGCVSMCKCGHDIYIDRGGESVWLGIIVLVFLWTLLLLIAYLLLKKRLDTLTYATKVC